MDGRKSDAQLNRWKVAFSLLSEAIASLGGSNSGVAVVVDRRVMTAIASELRESYRDQSWDPAEQDELSMFGIRITCRDQEA